MDMMQHWINHCLDLASKPADTWSRSSRKILRQQKLVFPRWNKSLQLDDIGFTSKKLNDLGRNYLHIKSRDVAVDLWHRQRDKAKYGSVCFSTFNHFIKGAPSVEVAEERRNKFGSVVGPCIQSVVITWLARDKVAIDVPFRSTELFKKFAADLIFLRDVLLVPFDFSGMNIKVTCYLANVTLHPGYWVTVLSHLDDPLSEMDEIRENDPYFYRQLVKHTAEYICLERGRSIANHAQSQRVKAHALRKITAPRLRMLREYVRDQNF